MVGVHLGQQGLVVGINGIESLFTSLVEYEGDLFVSNLIMTQNQKILSDRTFNSNSSFWISRSLNLNIHIKKSILDYNIVD